MARTAKKKREEENLPATVALAQPLAETFPPIPPLPVFEEHISGLLSEVNGFVCATEADFKEGASWRGRAVTLKNQIVAAFQPRKRAFDAAKQPTLDAESSYLNQVAVAIGLVDTKCIGWQREERRKADEEAARQRQAEIAKREKEKEERAAEELRKADFLNSWGDPEGAKAAEEVAKAIEAEVVIPPRQSTVDIPTYAKGVRTTPRLTASIVNPSAVNREFCIPSQSMVNAKVKTFSDFNHKPTEEQLKALSDEIGGIELNWD